MIRSFRHKGLKRLYDKDDKSRIRPDLVLKVREILLILDTAQRIEQVDIHGGRLHPLVGELRGFWSLRVSKNWRIVFRMEGGDVWDVDLVDYH